ncbi:hypothetical protein GGS21DRAFT_533404 [Xylaria nigripes]|nr:hypothetical protein GGS21DRAFT_533404 [Xylaria nigripes]
MADLKYILDMGDDGDPGNDKYSRQPSHFGSARGPNPSSTATKRDDNIQQTDYDPDKSLPSRHCPPNQSLRSPATTSLTAATATADKASSSHSPFSEQRRTSIAGPMDPVSYGNYTYSSSSTDMQASNRSNLSSRPVVNGPGEASLPVKLTPITGRVSRAKKGVPVHTCDVCKPPKTFTRAEHLRRHQLSHKPASFQCPYQKCGRVFYRQDLLTRHIHRHREQEGGSAIDTRGSTNRQPSHPSVERNTPSAGFLRVSMPGDNLSLTEGISGTSSFTGNASTYSPSHRRSISGQGPVSPSGHSPRSHSTGLSHSQDQGYILSTAAQMPHISYHSSSIDDSEFSGKAYRQAFQPRRSPSFASYMGLEGLATQLPNLTIPENELVGHLCTESNWSSSASDVSPYSTPDKTIIRGCSSPSADVHDPALFFVNPQFPSPQPSVYHSITEYATPFADETGCFEFSHSFSVRSQTPPTVNVSTQPAEHLVTIGHSVPEPPAILGRQKASAAFLSPFSDAAFLTAQVSSAAALNAIPRYLDAYWKRFDTFYPVIHRRNSETSADPVLRSAMAALGSQLLPSKEDRINSQALYDFASQEAGHYSRWNVQVMQAILLCEVYARFRGSRALSRPSEPFQSLYSRVAQPPTSDHHDFSVDTRQGRWDQWILTESYRRLLAACFALDVHTSMYHEHSTMHPFITQKPSVPLIKSSQRLWEAQDPEEWEALLNSNPAELEAASLADQEVNAGLVATAPILDVAVYLASETICLPRRSPPSTLDVSAGIDMDSTKRMCNLFPQSAVANTYLALHYTPLRDLLVVSGDSWLFSRKILDLDEFRRRKASVRTWSGSVRARAGSVFAAKALLIYLGINDNAPDSQDSTARNQQGEDLNMLEISRYWALFVCALICWSVGHRTGRGAMARGNSSGAYLSSTSTTISGKEEHGATGWLKMIASSSPEDAMQNFQGRRETLSVVTMVRRRLESETVGGKNKLLLYAVCVLKTLEEEPNRRRF